MISSKKTKTPYKLWKSRVLNIGYFKVFDSKCFILNTKERFENFDSNLDIGILFGYSSTGKVYRVFNKRTLVVEESVHVIFDETNLLDQEKCIENDVGLKIPLEKMSIQN